MEDFESVKMVAESISYLLRWYRACLMAYSSALKLFVKFFSNHASSSFFLGMWNAQLAVFVDSHTDPSVYTSRWLVFGFRSSELNSCFVWFDSVACFFVRGK